jgi:UDP-glucose 4-epimerase
MGDGTQSKSYILVGDVVQAVLTALERAPEAPFSAYNVATGDYITVREIAELALEVVDLTGTPIEYGSGNRGWKGDVPIVRLSTERIRGLGWQPSMGSREALRTSMQAMLADFEVGQLA